MNMNELEEVRLRKALQTYTFRKLKVPAHMHTAIVRYIVYKEAPGDFLSAVLRNDLRASVAHADVLNLQALNATVSFIYNEAPSACWGSPEAFNTWIGD